MMRLHTLLAAAGLALLAPQLPALAGKAETHTGLFGNVAVSGHDPVAYFREGRPVRGSRTFTARYKGAEYRFASAANRDAFIADPARYAPQYGGYCAWAVSQGYTASADPTVWRIVDGKLYLNYNAEVGREWEKDIPGHIRKANANWPKVLG
ncbi:MAG: YHS domain-containing (seleno)protein [Sphingomonadaceae bacterium]